MSTTEIIILAFALALDAFIVSFSYGLVININKLKNAFMLSFAFGLFQFIMPVLGWNFTSFIYEYLKIYSKWIVFAVFMFLAIKFLKEAFNNQEEIKIDNISILCIIGLAIATSIDAFGAGVSIRFLNENIIFSSVVIGITTFILSILGFYIANIFNKLPAKVVEIASAVLLMYLAIKSVL